MTALADAQAFVNDFNTAYEAKHEAFEQQFWGTKMALRNTDTIEYSTARLSATKAAMEQHLANAENIARAQEFRTQLTAEDIMSIEGQTVAKCLDIIVRTGKCYTMPKEAQQLRETTAQLEGELEMARNTMKLGYTDAEGTFHELSSVGLRNEMRTAEDEATRKAAYEALRSIGPFVIDNGFLEIVKLRNKMAKALGFIDYYDYKVTNAEGFGKVKLFEILDGLEVGTRAIMVEARKELAKRYGDDALEPWNMSFKMAGSIIVKMDPFFPFASAVERYVRSYAALGITYEGATMNLDLLDRPNKYSNGFCHWPKPAWTRPDGAWQPSVTNFTSLADPSAVGSGLTALTTLMHEAGHSAHFAKYKATQSVV